MRVVIPWRERTNAGDSLIPEQARRCRELGPAAGVSASKVDADIHTIPKRHGLLQSSVGFAGVSHPESRHTQLSTPIKSFNSNRPYRIPAFPS
jgi:hypothetical protein